MRVSTYTIIYFQKLESLAYIFVAACMGLPSFKFVQWAPKTHLFCTRVRFGRSRSFRVIQGRLFRYQSKARTRLPILVGHCDYGPILHRFRDMVTYFLKMADFCYIFCYPTLIRRPRSLCSPWNFALKLTVRKLEPWGILQRRPHDRFGMIPACDRRTVRRSDRIYHS